MKKSYYYPLKKGVAASETSFGINLLAFILATCILIICRWIGLQNYNLLFALFSVSITLMVICLEYVFYPQTCVYGKWKVVRNICWSRVFYKELTLMLTLLVIAFFYWIFPMFSYDDFIKIYFPFLKILVPFMLVCSIPYFAIMDKIDEEPDDVYYKIGYAVLHFKKTITSFEFGNYVRSWLVKAFWFSLMQPYMVHKIICVMEFTWDEISEKPIEWFWFLSAVCFFIDLAYASTGYLMNLKILNSHIRTAEPTLLGWFVAIMCYWPFWGNLFYPYFFRYEEIKWFSVFETDSILWWIWFGMIIFLELLYALATVAAGIRFSNLTYRGLWNTGIYKYTKHPAYVFKNISWWLVSVPFMSTSPIMAIKLSFLLLGNNIIYYLRAKTEERHLSHYPEYVKYALKMNDKSIFRWVARVLPFLKYKPLTSRKRLF